MSVKKNVYDYSHSIQKQVESFLDNYHSTVLEMGEFNPTEESYKIDAIRDYRKYGCKVVEEKTNEGKIKVSLMKLKLSKFRFG